MRSRTRLPTTAPLAARGCARSPLHALHLARAVGSARASVSRAMAGTVAAGVQAAPAFPLAEVRSSLPLEVALYFNGVYWPAFAIAELLLLVYKGARLARRSRAAATWRAARPPATIAATSRRRRLSAATELPYPPTALALEILFVLLYAIVEPVRLFLGASNKQPARDLAPAAARSHSLPRLSFQARAATRPRARGHWPCPWRWPCP